MSTSTKRRGGAGTKLTTGRNAGRSTRTQERTYTNEGIYSNCRYTHVATSLIGCTVQVQVRNGDIYDGVLDTVSSDMKVVLKKAHKISEFGANVIQSRDLLEEVVVYSLPDIVAINANDVDLEYAVKDSFTDGSISKYNGQVGEKELTPWDSEGGEELVLETGSSNGWDPDEMFKTNQEQFNVKSTYDDNLSQYTTVLDKSNPKYQRREEVAAKIAQEIEHTAGYRARIDLENGDGDEEDKFSAVVRPGADNSSSNGTANKWSNKKFPQFHSKHTKRYIPPDRRNRAVAHGDGPSRGSPSRPSQPHHRHGNTHAPPVMQHSPHLAPTQPPQPSPAELRVSPVSRSPVSTSPLPNPQTPPSTARTDTIQTEKGDSAVESPHPSSPPDPVIATEPKPNSVPASSPNNKTDHSGVSRDEEIRELIAFSSDFKLSESEGKTVQEKSTDVEGTEEPSERKETEQDSKDKQLAEAVKKSTLNPNAKEFVFNPKSMQPHSNASTPTPPRPHTQSPVIHPQQGMPLPYAIYPMGMPPMATSQPKVTKRAVVSLSQRSDFNAAAQAATGQPLLAQTTGPFMSYQLIPGAMPQHVHPNYHHQMLAVNPGTRMGPSVSVMSNPGGQEPNHQYSVPIFNTLTPPVPAHLPHPAPHQPPTPAHMSQHPGMAHHPQPHSQPHGGMAGPQGGGHHPPPSPVQPHTAPAPGPQPAGHPPSSGTPQSHIIFPGNPAGGVGQQSHPPLQASPHNPASPSAMHHLSMPTYTFNHPPHGHSMPGAPPMSIPAQAQHHPGSGPHMMHVAHSAGPQMMLPHPQHAAQMQPAHQFPGHQVPGHVGNQGPGGHMVQQPGMGVIPVSQSSASMPYIPHHQGVYRPG